MSNSFLFWFTMIVLLLSGIDSMSGAGGFPTWRILYQQWWVVLLGRKNMGTLSSTWQSWEKIRYLCVVLVWQSLFSVGEELLPVDTGVFLAISREVVFHKCHPLILCVLYLLHIHLANIYCTQHLLCSRGSIT